MVIFRASVRYIDSDRVMCMDRGRGIVRVPAGVRAEVSVRGMATIRVRVCVRVRVRI